MDGIHCYNGYQHYSANSLKPVNPTLKCTNYSKITQQKETTLSIIQEETRTSGKLNNSHAKPEIKRCTEKN